MLFGKGLRHLYVHNAFAKSIDPYQSAQSTQTDRSRKFLLSLIFIHVTEQFNLLYDKMGFMDAELGDVLIGVLYYRDTSSPVFTWHG